MSALLFNLNVKKHPTMLSKAFVPRSPISRDLPETFPFPLKWMSTPERSINDAYSWLILFLTGICLFSTLCRNDQLSDLCQKDRHPNGLSGYSLLCRCCCLSQCHHEEHHCNWSGSSWRSEPLSVSDCLFERQQVTSYLNVSVKTQTQTLL